MPMKLCPDCPFSGMLPEARKRLMEKQYILQEEPTVLKLCMELRIMAAQHGRECPHFKRYRSDSLPGLQVQSVAPAVREQKTIASFTRRET